MNDDLISRSALKVALKSNCKPKICHDYGTNWCEVCCPHNDFEDLIDNAPTVDAYPFEQVHELVKLNQQFAQEIENLKRPQGEWAEFEGGYRCSNCDDIEVYTPNFCPNCGAKMRGDKEE